VPSPAPLDQAPPSPSERPLRCEPGEPFSWQRETVGEIASERITSKAIAARDLDGDGGDELARALPNGSVEFWKRDDSRWVSVALADLSGPVETMVLADVTHDGRVDLVGAASTEPVLRIARGTAEGVGFEPVEVLPLPVAVASLTVLRLEQGDGLVVGSLPASELNGAWLLSSADAEPVPLPVQAPSAFVPADFDRDGDEDLAAGAGWLENLGDGRFSRHPLAVQSPASELQFPTDMSAADFDGDGYTDVAWMEGYAFHVLRNTRRSDFEPIWRVFQIYGLATVAGRVDCDELPDLVGVAGQQRLQLFLNGPNGFADTPSHTAPGDVLGIRSGDFDGDGRMDLAQPSARGECSDTACANDLGVLMAR